MGWLEYKKKFGWPFVKKRVEPDTSFSTPRKADFGPGISGYSGEYYGRYFGVSDGGDGSKWRYGLSASGSTPIMDHRLLRLNARSAYHDSLQGRAIIDRFADMVPGVGLRLEAAPDFTVLGMTPEAAAEWSQDVNAKFDSYMRSKKFSLSEDMTGYQSQRFVAIQQQRDGEYFARLHYNRRGNLNPLQVSFIDPEFIDGYAQTDTAGYHMVDSGIERDSSGREVAYYVLTYDPVDFRQQRVRLRRLGPRSKRVLMLHGYQKEYPNQTRGYSRIGHVLQHLENLTDFELSHIKKAIHESIIAMYVKPSKDHPASDGGITDGMAYQAGPFRAPENPLSATEVTGGSYVDLSELNEVNARPGSWFNAGLQGGEDLKTLNATTPAQNYNTFVDAFVNSLAASMGQSSEAVWMKFGNSFSASRAALVLAWQVIEIWRRELEADYLDPIYEMWLSGEIAAGRISAPGWADLILRQAWLNNNWVGFPMPNIDPSKTAKAQEMYINMGATTLDRVARELNGSSGKANRAQLAREFAELPQSPFNPNAVDDSASEEEDDNGNG